MTYENYEKAKELNSRMEYIDNLMDLIRNSVDNDSPGSNIKALAAIRIEKMDGPYVVTECSVINHEILDKETANDMIELLKKKYVELDKEFKAI